MSPIEQTMNFLNEAAGRYPGAVSFLAGRPPDEFVDISPISDWINHYIVASGNQTSCRRMLGQYSDTNGICRDILADYLTRSLGTEVSTHDCMIVNGAQEGMLIAVAGICGRDRIALAADPTYVGFAGAAALIGTPLETIPDDDDFVGRLVERMGKRDQPPGCVYLVPDFANPTGRTLSLAERDALISAAHDFGVILVEDIAYRRYRYNGEDLPTLYTLAQGKGVVLIESFAKTIMPGLRSGVLVASMKGSNGMTLANRLSSNKSYVSVATSPIIQAALAGCLLQNDGDIAKIVAPRIQHMRERRDVLVSCLEDQLGSLQTEMQWQCPEGGFFLTLDVGAPFSLDDCISCAREAGVLALPMQAFSLHGTCTEKVRLSFSNIDPAEIGPAAERLLTWLRSQKIYLGRS